MPRILIATGDAAESLEVMYPYQRLLEEGYEVDVAAPSKKKLQFVVHDFVEGYDTYTEKPGYTMDADVAFADVDPSDYAALVIPGRPGARVHPQRPRLPADRPAVLLRRQAGRAAVPRAARARRRRRARRPPHRGVSRAGARRHRRRRRVRRRRRGRRRRHGLGARLARPPGVDARVRPAPARARARRAGDRRRDA